MTDPATDPGTTRTATEASSHELVETVDVAAPPAQVWAVVADLRRMPERSPQVWRTFVSDGPVRLGTRMLNVNRRGALVWPTRAEVVRFEPHRDIAFRIRDNWTIWSYELVETAEGTRVVHRRETPDGISRLSRGFTRALLGGSEKFAVELRAGMRQTLARLKAEAEAS